VIVIVIVIVIKVVMRQHTSPVATFYRRRHGGCGGECTVMDFVVTRITIGVSEWNRYR